MEDLIQILHDGRHSLVVGNGEVCTFDGRGVSDLYRLLHADPGFLAGSSVADKVVGKAAASLMVLAKVREVYADVMSRPALDLLEAAGVKAACARLVPHIMNRSGADWCPLERRCFACCTPQECFREIETFLGQQAG